MSDGHQCEKQATHSKVNTTPATHSSVVETIETPLLVKMALIVPSITVVVMAEIRYGDIFGCHCETGGNPVVLGVGGYGGVLFI